MTLNGEQLKVLGKFLGLEPTHTYVAELRKDFQPVIRLVSFQEWLLSNDGQAALMNRLDSYGIEYNFISHANPYMVVLDVGTYETVVEGGTRQEVFIKAVLNMLKGKNNGIMD